MDEATARRLIEQHGRGVSSIRRIPEGRNHYVFDVLLADGAPAIAKFTITLHQGEYRRDSLFGGRRSLKREAAIYKLVRETSGLPAPRIYVQHESDQTSFLLVEKLGGCLWREHLAQHGFKRDVFLRSMAFLGKDIARLQHIHFESFGDVMGARAVSPSGIDNFAERFEDVMHMRIDRAANRGVFSASDIAEIRRHFRSGLGAVAAWLDAQVMPPVMVFTDLHADNFLVDQDGRPSGYFDLESCQAAHPALELCSLRLFLFNYLGGDSFADAEAAFFSGYRADGGAYQRSRTEVMRLEHLLEAGRLLELTESYYEYRDGLRDDWSDRFRRLFWQALRTNRIDYAAVGAIYREKTGQPAEPR